MIPRDELLNQKLVLLTEGHLDLYKAKTAAAVARYRPDDVTAVLDTTQAGRTLGQVIGVGGDLPIVASIAEAVKLSPKPTALLIGIAPSGGKLPPTMRGQITDALSAGLNIISGLHTPLSNDPELAALAEANGVKLYDVRQVDEDLPIARGEAADWPVRRVLTVGSDCNIGKKITALELAREMERRGKRAAFVPTGQTGIMLAGWGLAVDRTISDFASGAGQWLVEQVKDHDFAFVEGQGALDHTGYSSVTLSQIHGVLPHWMVLCHLPGRQVHMSSPVPIKPLGEVIEMVEAASSWVSPPGPAGKVVAVALNTFTMSDGDAEAALLAAADETGLPAFDPVRTGCGKAIDVLLKLSESAE